ncbi:MAG: thiol-disulfide oxidoreductase DCC family protein [Paracoccaceae bacterium]
MDVIEVLYNRQCPLCAAEIGHYETYAKSKHLPILFIDLNTAQLHEWGLSSEQAGRRLHVRKGTQLDSGITAFLHLWRAMPRYAWIARVVDVPGLRHLAEFAYNRILAPWIYRAHVKRQARIASM